MGLREYSSMEDAEIVKLANDGDILAMEYIIEKYKGYVRTKTRTYFLIGADRDDLIQEGMIGLFKAIRDFNPDKQVQFKAFAELCITRQIITAIKTATRQKHSPLNTYVSLNKPVYEDENERTLVELIKTKINSNPEEIVIDRENLGITEQKIKSVLSKFELEVLELFLDGKSYIEIATHLEKTPKSIDNAIQRIKRKINQTIFG